MEQDITFHVIAHMQSSFPEKFGIPRQSGLVEELTSRIVFTQEYRIADALRGLSEFSHLWIIWQFSGTVRDSWSPTVRPPRLGGNQRMGVFATRSPFRPNEIGLSCVKILNILYDTPDGPVIEVGGADLMDGTPILDIKPYIPYADCHPEAVGGFTDHVGSYLLNVQMPEDVSRAIPSDILKALTATLSHDPRPSYHQDPDRIYGMQFSGLNVRFRVDGETLIVISADTINP